MAIFSVQSQADFKKGFFLGAGLLAAVIVVGFASGALRSAL